MGNKDITERSLEWFNDVFSDIVNAWFAVNGVEGFTVIPEDLQDALTRERLIVLSRAPGYIPGCPFRKKACHFDTHS